MPVTAVLSKKFYEKFGEDVTEDVTNELVNWFNAVDATYRADLRELNELNFARFDAKLGERLTQLRGEHRSELSELRSELSELRAELKVEFAEGLRSLETRLVRWMLGLWISTLLGLGALFFRA